MVVVSILLNPVEIGPERILSNFLQIDIDGGVDTKAFVHRAVPSDCRDYLLADVIDRVGLSLRVLPIADDDLLRSRIGVLFTADEVKIAHPIERIVAHFT